jgi:O-antigen ligase
MSKFTSELFEFNKIMLIYFIAALVFFLWVLKSVKEKKILFKRTVLDIPILTFLLSQILSTIFSIDKYTSFFGYYGRFNGGLLSIIVYIFLYYGFVSFFDTKKFEFFLKTSIWSSLIVILWGLPGKFGLDLSCYLFVGQLNNNCWINQFRPSERLFSTLGQPNWLAAYLLINFFVALYFLFKNHDVGSKKTSKILYFAYLILNFAVILFTRSRSAYLALIIGLIIFAYFYFKNIIDREIFYKENKKIIIGFFAVILVVVFIFKTGIAKIDNFISFYKNKPVKIENIKKNSNQKNISSQVTESFDIRKIVWKGAVKLGLKYPLFGSGVETFAYAYYFVRPVEHNLTSEWDYLYNKAHNEYLNYFATTGFVGLITYIYMICFILYLVYYSIVKGRDESKKLFRIFLSISYLTILITNFFGFSTTTINLFFYIIPALLISDIVKNDFEFIFNRRELRLFKFSGWLFSIFFIFYLICFYLADLRYAKAIAYSKEGDYQKASLYLDNALSLHQSHVYLNQYSYDLVKVARLAYLQKDYETGDKLIDMSLKSANEAIKHSSKNVIYWKNRSTIHSLIYEMKSDIKYLDNAIQDLKKAQTLSPTDPKIPFNLAIYYLIMHDEKKDLKYKNLYKEYLNKSLKLKPNFEDALNLKKRFQML